MPKIQDNDQQMRLDKWLWCARFYKTRSLAAEAIRNGKVLIGGKRVKPSRTISVNDRIILRRGAFEYDLVIRVLAKSRKSSKEAILLYEESPESIQKRETLAEQIRLNAMSAPGTHGRPTKRDRRKIIRFKNKSMS